MILKKQKKSAEMAHDGDAETQAMTETLARALNNPLKKSPGAAGLENQDLRYTLRAIESTFYLVDEIRDVLVEACHLVLRANAVADIAGRAILAEQYDEMRSSIQRLVEGADEEAADLVSAEAQGIVARMSNVSSYTVFPARLTLGENALDLPPPSEGFAETQEVADILRKLDRALERLDTISTSYMKDAQYLMSKLGR